MPPCHAPTRTCRLRVDADRLPHAGRGWGPSSFLRVVPPVPDPPPPLVPCHERPPHLTPTRSKASPPSTDTIRPPLSIGDRFPPTKSIRAPPSPLFPVRAVTTRVSFLFLLLGSSLTYPFISMTYRDNVGSPPAIVSHPPPSERHCVSLSLPPHRCSTSSVSHAAILLARCTPLTILVPVPLTTPQGSHR
jgi:hypothetical protein